MNYAVDCPSCGRQSLSEDEYAYQMSKPDSLWKCPNCGGNAWFNDDVYEANFQEDEL